MIHRLRFLDLLRRHVMRRAHHVARAGQPEILRLLAQNFREAEVGDFHPAFFIEQNVFRFYVAVDDAFVMRKLERGADLWDDFQRLARRSLPACSICRRFGPSTYSMTKKCRTDVAPVSDFPPDISDGDRLEACPTVPKSCTATMFG